MADNIETAKSATQPAGESETSTQEELREKIHTEQPSRPIPGKRAFDFPDYESWTDEELHAFAENLAIPGQEQLEREALIAALIDREHR